ncbi:MAG: HAMP domain-containing histidine kinase [Leptospiraceae bacterium]|nr:HAMP domain-containing histidine kinase [Leptospiraceae bacterium]MCP5497312.1 HAMP domain-containing histidine kinase [Leptospiraceae bacterium]
MLEDEIQELQSIFDGITDPLILIGENLTIKKANQATMDFVYGTNSDSLISQKCYKALYNREQICPYCPLNEQNNKQKKEDKPNLQLISQAPQNHEIMVKNEGQNLKLNLYFFPIKKNDNVYAFVERISNVTKVKEKEEENLRMRNLASLGILVSGVAHELNNPLTGIGLTVQNLLNNINNLNKDLIQNRLELIKKDLSRTAFIVSDIISFAKPGGIKITLADIRETIQRAKETVIRLYPILTQNIGWEIITESDNLFYFNPVKFERVFLNLFQNSLQAFDYRKGKILVEVKRKGDTVHIIIEDDAGGISEKIITKIFDPFFSSNNSGTGTGLGLSICYSIVKEHHGKINVRSFDQKTRFIISLPAYHPVKNTDE